MLVDYLTFNAPAQNAVLLIGRMPNGWTSTASQAVAYSEVKRRGGIVVSMPTHPKGTAHVEVKGHGCRELEAAGVVLDWQAFLREMLDAGAKFTRLDCAIDDRDGLLDLNQIIAACEDGRVVSAYQNADPRPKMNPATGERTGDGVTFGNRASETYIRIYDKGLQTKSPDHWIRVELEAKKTRAQALAEAISKKGASVVPSILIGYLDFKERGATDRRDRWPTATWWKQFLGTEQRFRLESAPRNVSLEKAYSWFIRQCSRLFALIYDSGEYPTFLEDLLADGRRKQDCKTAKTAHTQTVIPKPG
ncbi:MAG: replication initiation factor domain-containing protein [Janthinobacterium lividum]